MPKWISRLCLCICLVAGFVNAADSADQQEISSAYARLRAKQSAATQPAAGVGSSKAATAASQTKPGHEEEDATVADFAALAAEHAVAVAVAGADEVEERKLRVAGSVSGTCRFLRDDGSVDVLRGMQIYVVHKTLSAEDEAPLLLAEAGNLRKLAAQQEQNEQSDAAKSRSRQREDPVAVAPQHADDQIDLKRTASVLEQSAKTLKGNRDVKVMWEIAREHANDIPYTEFMRSTVVAETKTGVNGKFELGKLPGGSYYVYASSKSAAPVMEWIIPLIIDGNHATVDLNGDTQIARSAEMQDLLTDRQATAAAASLRDLSTAEAAQTKADEAARDTRIYNSAAGAAAGMGQAREIADGIAARHLVEGMTMSEAIKTAHARPRLLSSTADAKTYRWEIHAQIGAHIVTSIDSFGQYHHETVLDYGIVDYSDATFIDGKLSSIDRGGDFSDTTPKQGDLWGHSRGSVPRSRTISK